MNSTQRSPASAYLHCIFAEDVRQESNGQRTIVGMFPGGVRLHAVPAAIPKLAIFAELVLPMNIEAHALTLEILMDDVLLQRVDTGTISLDESRAQAVAQSTDTHPRRAYGVQFVFLMANFTVGALGIMRLVATVDDIRIEGNGLRFELGSEAGAVHPAHPH